MNIIHFKSCKIAPSLRLDRIAAFLNTQMQFSWKEYITLAGDQLNTVLKYNTSSKYVYLFSYGCASFVNFDDNEIYTFIKYIETIEDKVKYDLIHKFFENHTLHIHSSNRCKLWKNSDTQYNFSEDIIHNIAVILAKSTELYKLEMDLNNLMDSSEKFIFFLQKGRLGLYTKKSSEIISKILRFEYRIIQNIRIFERPTYDEEKKESREIYDALLKYYELNDRFNIFKGKMDELREILKLYSKLSHNQTESRLLYFEIFLLLLFPVFHFIHYIWDSPDKFSFIFNILK